MDHIYLKDIIPIIAYNRNINIYYNHGYTSYIESHNNNYMNQKKALQTFQDSIVTEITYNSGNSDGIDLFIEKERTK